MFPQHDLVDDDMGKLLHHKESTIKNKCTIMTIMIENMDTCLH